MDLTCSPNTLTAFDYFLRKGLKDFQAAGIVGNLMQESGINPFAAGTESDGTVAHGIAQWGERWQNLLTYAQQSSRDPFALDLQLDFLWYELQSAPATLGLDAVRSATTLEAAVLAFQGGPGWGFERCGDCQTANRIAYAKAALLGCSSLVPPIVRRYPKTAGVVFTLSALALVAGAAYAAGWKLKRERQ